MQHHLDLARDIGARLVARGWTLASAESCTGGLIGHLITEVAGSSRYYLGGIIAYSNAVKQAQLGVPATVLLDHGAVSEATARAMATGVRHALQADVGLATTGIAGPGGATPTKPVGLVYVAVATPLGQHCLRFVFSGDRQAIKQQSAAAALHLLLDTLEPAAR